jgi:hypothetical protein
MSATCEHCGTDIPVGCNLCGVCGPKWSKAQSRLERQERVGRNKSFAVEMLRECNVSFQVKNNGEHVIVAGNPATDYWPGTGLFIQRKTKKEGRGIYNLLKLIGVKAPKETRP